MRTQSSLPKKGAKPPPQFFAHVYCGQTAGWIKMALAIEVGLSPGDFVLDGDQLLLKKRKGSSPSEIFGPFLLWPMAKCIKVPLGMEIGLSPGDFVLDGEPAPSPKQGPSSPIFSSCLLRSNGWMDQEFKMPLGTWYGGRPHPRRLC